MKTTSAKSTDHQLRSAVELELGWAANINADGIGVAVHGEVPWDYQRRAAIQAVTTLRGVRDVRSEILIKPSAAISPATAKAKITSAIMRNAQLQANRIEPLVNGSEITLTGVVTSWAARTQAEYAAWAVPGVSNVRNLLRLG